MLESELQDLCEKGQQLLMATRYLDAVHTLTAAEQAAWETKSFDTLSRLYLPLQEARRQIRQRCGEGAVRMHLIASAPDTPVDPTAISNETSTGQLLIAGWDSIEPALQLRHISRERHLYLETFLASFDSQMKMVRIVPTEDGSHDQHSVILHPADLPPDADKGTAQTYAGVMALWERLHLPFLSAAEGETDPIQKMQAYRFTIQVDPACELAHQFLADIARHLARAR